MKKKLRILLLIVLLIIFIIINFDNKPNHNAKEDLIKEETQNNEIIKINKIEELQNKYHNKEIIGIISMENNENFSYPIAKSNNNNYYLTHNYYKEYDKYGAIYADYRIDLDTSKKVLIFGHSYTDHYVPFNELEKYEQYEYFLEHPTITIETEDNKYVYNIFSVFIETNDFTYMNIKFSTPESWYAHIVNLKTKSFYDTKESVLRDDDILILQTCSNNSKYLSYKQKYLLVVARKQKNTI